MQSGKDVQRQQEAHPDAGTDQTMDLLGMIKSFQTEVDTFNAELNQLTNQMVSAREVTREDEAKANSFMKKVNRIRLQMEEFKLYVTLFFYDSNVFAEELPPGNEGYQMIKQLHEFLEERTGLCDVLQVKLQRNLEGAHSVANKARAERRQREMESLTKQQVEEDINAYMADFQKDMMEGLAEIKQGQLELRDELEVAQEKGEELQQGIQETTEVVKAATEETNKAREALKKNKDVLYLGISVALCAAAVIVLVFM